MKRALIAALMLTAASCMGQAANPGLLAWIATQTAASTTLVTNGLVAYWKLDNNYVDSYGTNDGTSVLSTWTNGVDGVALHASYAYTLNPDWNVACGRAGDLMPTSAVSVACWVQSTAAQSSFGGIIKGPQDGPNGGYILVIDSAEKIRFYIDQNGAGSWAYASGNAALTEDTWYHLVGTWDGTTVKLYVNNVLQTTTGSASVISYGTVDSDAHMRWYTAKNMIGILDEARIHNIALTTNQISELYNEFSP